MAAAALRPSARAVVTRSAPRTTSPPAKIPGVVVIASSFTSYVPHFVTSGPSEDAPRAVIQEAHRGAQPFEDDPFILRGLHLAAAAGHVRLVAAVGARDRDRAETLRRTQAVHPPLAP